MRVYNNLALVQYRANIAINYKLIILKLFLFYKFIYIIHIFQKEYI